MERISRLPAVSRRLLAWAALGAWTALAVLSLVPGEIRPHTGAAGNVEHAVAYFLAALVTSLAFPRARGRAFCLLVLMAGIFEVCQIWIPGRGAGVGNWLASGAGALAGIVLPALVGHFASIRSRDGRLQGTE